MKLGEFEVIVKRGVYYEAESDADGARVYTNLENTPCPRCRIIVEPNKEHLCGNRSK